MVSHTRVKGEGGLECEFVLCEYASWCAAPSVRLRAEALCGVSGRGAGVFCGLSVERAFRKRA